MGIRWRDSELACGQRAMYRQVGESARPLARATATGRRLHTPRSDLELIRGEVTSAGAPVTWPTRDRESRGWGKRERTNKKGKGDEVCGSREKGLREKRDDERARSNGKEFLHASCLRLTKTYPDTKLPRSSFSTRNEGDSRLFLRRFLRISRTPTTRYRIITCRSLMRTGQREAWFSRENIQRNKSP